MVQVKRLAPGWPKRLEREQAARARWAPHLAGPERRWRQGWNCCWEPPWAPPLRQASSLLRAIRMPARPARSRWPATHMPCVVPPRSLSQRYAGVSSHPPARPSTPGPSTPGSFPCLPGPLQAAGRPPRGGLGAQPPEENLPLLGCGAPLGSARFARGRGGGEHEKTLLLPFHRLRCHGSPTHNRNARGSIEWRHWIATTVSS